MVSPAPKHSGPTFGVGSAARQQARKEAHTQKHRDAFARVKLAADGAMPEGPPRLLCCSCGWERLDRFPELPLSERRCGACPPEQPADLRLELLDGTVLARSPKPRARAPRKSRAKAAQ